jgi:hypothetical protein
MVGGELCRGLIIVPFGPLGVQDYVLIFRYHWLKSYSWRNPLHVLAFKLGCLKCCDEIQWGRWGSLVLWMWGF